jgi:peptidoglycan DL-endopeptidase CwlO
VNRPVPFRGPGRRARFHSPNPSAHLVGGRWEKERVSHVHTRPSGSRTLIGTLWRRGAGIPLGLLAVGGLVFGVGGAASAAPQPTIAQVQARLSQLNTKAQQLDQQYDQAQQALNSANDQLTAINTEIARDQVHYKAMRAKVAEIAAVAYENGGLDSPTSLLTSDNPQKILNQASMLQELSSSNSAEMAAFISAARQLANAQKSAARTKQGKLALTDQLQGEKNQNNQLIAQQQALLNQLTPQQAAAVGLGGGSGSGGGVTIGQAPVATSAQAQAAIDYAYAQVQMRCPYVFGGTGPCPDGFDCSGLMMASWAAAGVSIERTSYEQMSSLPSVPLSELQPGDILGFAGNSHVGMYVGHNELIDAPQSGEDVEEVPLSGWYAENLDGAVQP